MDRIVQQALTVCLVLTVAGAETGWNVFPEARAQSGIRSRRSGTGSFNVPQRWGTPAARGYRSPGESSSSPSWTLRHTSTRNPSVNHGHQPSFGGHGQRSYSARPPLIGYSAAPPYSHAYGGYGHHRDSHHHGPLHAYDQARIRNGLPIQYSLGFGASYGYGIFTPPIVLPYGGFSTTPFLPPAPAPGLMIPSASNEGLPQGVSGAVSRPLAPDGPAIVNEFGTFRAVNGGNVATVDRVRSLRYQTSGDLAFREQEYDSAELYYQTAANRAPARRAPWLRLAWSQIAQQKFANAVGSLKTALSMSDDPTSSWVSRRDLYGAHVESQSDVHNDQLWNWLQERPNSTDRLLLAAAFQQLRGHTGISSELLDAAFRNGLDRGAVTALREIAGDLADRNDPAEGEPGAADLIDQQNQLDKSLNAADDGIRMRGRKVVPAAVALPSEVGPPEPLPPGEELPTVNPPTPQDSANSRRFLLTIPPPTP